MINMRLDRAFRRSRMGFDKRVLWGVSMYPTTIHSIYKARALIFNIHYKYILSFNDFFY